MWEIFKDTPTELIFLAQLNASQNAKYRLDFGNIGAGDTFKITIAGVETGSVTYADPMTTDIDTAVEAHASVGAGNATVTRISASVYDIEFISGKANTDMGLITITSQVGFTATGVTVTQNGGTAGQVAGYITFVPGSEFYIYKMGGSTALAAGTVKNIDYTGAYGYTPTASEVNTFGSWMLVHSRTDLKKFFVVGQVKPPYNAGQPTLDEGTLQSGGTSTIKLASTAPSFNGFRGWIMFPTGTGAGQFAYIYGYNGTSKDANLEPALTVAVDGTTTYKVFGGIPPSLDLNPDNHTYVGSLASRLASPDDVVLELGLDVDDLGRVKTQKGSTG